jgi:type III pantothenate kinase
MKVLAIDAGNSRIKWGWFDGARWAAQGWVATAEAGKLAAALAGVQEADAVVVANVAGEAARSAIEAAARPLGGPLRWVRGRARQCGIVSSYADPAQLGADRWAALIGAWHLVQGPCAVVNAGTTLTVDALSGEGVFLGGCIVPGAELMRTALAGATAQLPLQDGKFAYFPDCTADAIMSGAINALAGAVERMLQYMERTCGAPPAVVLSGGAAPLIAPQLNAPVQLVDNLVLEGLLCIARESSAVSGDQ